MESRHSQVPLIQASPHWSKAEGHSACASLFPKRVRVRAGIVRGGRCASDLIDEADSCWTPLQEGFAVDNSTRLSALDAIRENLVELPT
jgi:hypothetical protein